MLILHNRADGSCVAVDCDVNGTGEIRGRATRVDGGIEKACDIDFCQVTRGTVLGHRVVEADVLVCDTCAGNLN
jgi:hypothetical protein